MVGSIIIITQGDGAVSRQERHPERAASQLSGSATKKKKSTLTSGRQKIKLLTGEKNELSPEPLGEFSLTPSREKQHSTMPLKNAPWTHMELRRIVQRECLGSPPLPDKTAFGDNQPTSLCTGSVWNYHVFVDS